MSRFWRSPAQKAQVIAQIEQRGTVMQTASKLHKKTDDVVQTALQPKRPARGTMNKTEADYARILDAQKARGIIADWAYEPFKIRLAEDTTYTPDFVSIAHFSNFTVAELRELATSTAMQAASGNRLDDLVARLRSAAAMAAPGIVIHEIKGGMVWEKNRIKFKMARETCRWAHFELWQRTKGEWKQLL